MLEVIPDAAESQTRPSDCFRPAMDASRTTSVERPRWKRSAQTDPIQGLAASNFTVWRPETLRVVQSRAISADWQSPMLLQPAEAEFVRQVNDDFDEMTDPLRQSSSAALCRRFIEGVGLALAHHAGIRCAVFAEEGNSVTVMAHSRAAKRQVSFEFGPDGQTITIVSIDEDLRRTERKCGMRDKMTLGNAIAWLTRRS